MKNLLHGLYIVLGCLGIPAAFVLVACASKPAQPIVPVAKNYVCTAYYGESAGIQISGTWGTYYDALVESHKIAVSLEAYKLLSYDDPFVLCEEKK